MKILKILLGILFIATVGYAYYKIPQWLFEGTAISNTLAGLVLIVDGILLFKKKKMPMAIYQMVVCFIMTVYIVTTFLTAFNFTNIFSFDDGFMFLHSVNPIIFFMIYLFTTKLELKDNKDIFIRSCIAPLFIVLYLIFDLTRKQIVGEYVYQLIPNNTNIILVFLFGIIAYVLEVAFNYGIIKLKKVAESKLR